MIEDGIRKTVREYPTLAIREALANAMIHQDFTLTGMNLSVEIFDNRVAILTGDYILSTALIRSIQTGDLRIVGIVSNLGRDLSEGEIKQMETADESILDEDCYLQVIYKKTATLLSACTTIGAISAGAGDAQIGIMRRFGELIGYAFQIKDDIFDYFDNAELGKPTGNDMMEGKLTLPAIYALNRTNNQEMHNLALRIRSLKATKDEIASFIAFVKQEGGIEYADRVMCGFCDKALALLPVSVDPIVKKALIAYIDFVIDREI